MASFFYFSPMEITLSTSGDRSDLLNLYRLAAENPAGLIRHSEEFDEAYIDGVLSANEIGGLSLVARAEDGRVVGEIHAFPYNIRALSINLTDLTIAVHPDFHGRGIGRRLFTDFLRRMEESFRHILRVELFTRSDNERNRKFYASLGFKEEGAQHHKILDAEGELQTPIHMAWYNPFFEKPTGG